MKFFDQIEKFYCLNISDKRKSNIQKYEKLMNTKFDTSLSVNGFKLDKNQLKKDNIICEDYNKSLGAIGCTLSFGNIYKDIVKNKYKYSIIFEDDITWNYQNYKTFNLVDQLEKIKEIPNDWDLIYLGTRSKGGSRKVNKNIYKLNCGKIQEKYKEKTFECWKESLQTNKLKNHRNFGGLHAILITYNGAQEILEHYDPIMTISDGIMSYTIQSHKINHYAFIPSLFNQLSNRGENSKHWHSLTGSDANEFKKI